MKEQLDQIESLKIVQAAASDELSALALFREIDADGSGQLDEEEFGNLLTCMGLSMSPEQVLCLLDFVLIYFPIFVILWVRRGFLNWKVCSSDCHFLPTTECLSFAVNILLLHCL